MIPSRIPRAAALALALTLACIGAAPAAAQDAAERRAAAHLERVRERTPELYAFLRQMPKGADLHSHLSGVVYAENFLRWAAEDGSCVHTVRLAIVNAPCQPSGDTLVAASAVLTNPGLHGALVDAFSMRNWHPARIDGHDQFFSTFGRFDALDVRVADELAEAQSRAAAGNVSYLELMQTLDGRASRTLGQQAGWQGSFPAMRDTLLALGIASTALPAARARLTALEARRDSLLGCGTPAARPGCGVAVRWLYQVARAQAPERVFAQILMGFLMAEADPRVVGLNLVQPEDWHLSMRDYTLHMRMIEYLRRLYPGVQVTLHAGELAPGLVPPEGLRSHVREAVEIAGASRIGHGVDVMYEDDPYQLLREMAARGVMVEINLTSNDVILGVSGDDHPLRAYLDAGVPVALSTDDEGVARSEMTMEYVKAVQEQGLDYPTLKRMARTSLEHAFIGGESVWRDARRFTPVAACAGGWDAPACRALAARSPRAALQVALERDFRAFEAWAATLP